MNLQKEMLGEKHPNYASTLNNLAALYSNGRGALQDYVTAYSWFNLAASQGSDMAKGNRDAILEIMSPSQIEEGQKLSQKLYDKIYNQDR